MESGRIQDQIIDDQIEQQPEQIEPKGSIVPAFSDPQKVITIKVGELRDQHYELPINEKRHPNDGLVFSATFDYFFPAQGTTLREWLDQTIVDYVNRTYQIEGLSKFGFASQADFENKPRMLEARQERINANFKNDPLRAQIARLERKIKAKESGRYDDKIPGVKEEIVLQIQQQIKQLREQVKQNDDAANDAFDRAAYDTLKAKWMEIYKDETLFMEFLESQSQSVAYVISTPINSSFQYRSNEAPSGWQLDPSKIVIKQPSNFIVNVFRTPEGLFCEVYAEQYPIKQENNTIGSLEAPTKALFKVVKKNIGTVDEPNNRFGFELIDVQTTNPLIAKIYRGELLTHEELKPYITPKGALLGNREFVQSEITRYTQEYIKQKDPRLIITQHVEVFFKTINPKLSNDRIKKMNKVDLDLYSDLLRKMIKLMTNASVNDINELSKLAEKFAKKHPEVKAGIEVLLKSSLEYYFQTISDGINRANPPQQPVVVEVVEIEQVAEQEIEDYPEFLDETPVVKPQFDLKTLLTPVLDQIQAIKDSIPLPITTADLVQILFTLDDINKNLEKIADKGSVVEALSRLMIDIELVEAKYKGQTHLLNSLKTLNSNLYAELTKMLMKQTPADSFAKQFQEAIEALQARAEKDQNDPYRMSLASRAMVYMIKTINENASGFNDNIDQIQKFDAGLAKKLKDLRITALLAREMPKFKDAADQLLTAQKTFHDKYTPDEYEQGYKNSIIANAISIEARLRSILLTNYNLSAGAPDNYTKAILAIKKLLEERSEANWKSFKDNLGNVPYDVKALMIEVQDELKHLDTAAALRATLANPEVDESLKKSAQETLVELKRVAKEGSSQLNLATEIMKEMNAHIRGERAPKVPQRGNEPPNPNRLPKPEPQADVSKLYSLAYQAEKIPTWKKVVAGVVGFLGGLLFLGGVALIATGVLAPAGLAAVGIGAGTVIAAGSVLTAGAIIGTGLAQWSLLKPPALVKSAQEFGRKVQEVAPYKPKAPQ